MIGPLKRTGSLQQRWLLTEHSMDPDLVRPHEADEEDSRQTHGEDIQSPEPGALLCRHQKLRQQARLQRGMAGHLH